MIIIKILNELHRICDRKGTAIKATNILQIHGTALGMQRCDLSFGDASISFLFFVFSVTCMNLFHVF